VRLGHRGGRAMSRRVPFQPGQKLGTSPWLTVTQALIDQFGAATLDPDPLHIDPSWARAHSPYGGTIAFGFWTMSVLTHLFHATLGSDRDHDPAATGYPLNYGFDRLRLLAPVPVGGRIRAHFTCLEVRGGDGKPDVAKVGVEIEIEGTDKPALAGEWLFAWMGPTG